MERYLKENLNLNLSPLNYFTYVIMTCMQGSGSKFYVIMPEIVIKYIKNTFQVILFDVSPVISKIVKNL